MQWRRGVGLATVVLLAVQARADVHYQSETQVKFAGTLGTMVRLFGGSKPVVSTVSLKGNVLRTDNEQTSQIIDLDRGVFVDIDHKKKQFTEMTFAQMIARMQAAMDEAKKEAASAPEAGTKPRAQVKFHANVQPTGKKQTLDGHDTESVLLTLTVEGQDSTGAKGSMVTTSEMWMAKDLKGYGELQAFHQRLGEKLGRDWTGGAKFMDMLAASYPEMAAAMQELQKQSRAIEGTPLLTTITMDAASQPSPKGEAASAPQSEAAPKDEGVKLEKPSIGGVLGRFGKKKIEEHQKEKQAEKAAEGGRSNLMTSTTRTSGFSTESLSPSLFDLPAGYKKVEPKD